MKIIEINPNTCGDLAPIFDKGGISVNEEKVWTIQHIELGQLTRYQETKLDLYFTPFIWTNSKYIKDKFIKWKHRSTKRDLGKILLLTLKGVNPF